MRERISPYGGTLETGPREQGGFRVFETLRNPRSTRDRETVKRGPSTATCESLSLFRQDATVIHLSRVSKEAGESSRLASSPTA